MAFSMIFIIASIFSVCAVSSNSLNSSNVTNSTNSTNVTKSVTNNAVIQPMSVFISLDVSPTAVTVTNLMADGTERSIGTTTAHVQSWLGSGNLYVSSSGDFISSTDNIPLSNFKFECTNSNPVVNKRSFTTSDYSISRYSSGLLTPYDYTYNINYYLTVPVGTAPGTYTTTITYTAT